MIGYWPKDSSIWVVFSGVRMELESEEVNSGDKVSANKHIPFDAWPECDCKLNKSFLDAAMFIYPEIIKTIEDQKLTRGQIDSIKLSGHSKGAAITQIIGTLLTKDGYDAKLINFA